MVTEDGQRPRHVDELWEMVRPWLREPAVTRDQARAEAQALEGKSLHVRFVDASGLDHRLVFADGGLSMRPGADDESYTIQTTWDAYVDFFECRCSKAALFMDGDWAFSHGRTGAFDFFEVGQPLLAIERRLLPCGEVDPSRAVAAVSAVSSTLPDLAAIPRETDLGIEQFHARYARPGRPAILRDACADWPTRTFTFDLLLEIYGASTLVHESAAMHVSSFPVRDCLERVKRNDPMPQKVALPLTRAFLRHYRHPRYFPQDSYFSKSQSVIVSPADATGTRGYHAATSWHCDLADNFLVQLIGQKRVWLAPPHQRGAFYLRAVLATHDNVCHCVSPIDPKAPDLQRYPRFGEATLISCVLEPGDMLYLPCGWFHNVDNVTPSVAVNCWKVSPLAEVAPALGAPKRAQPAAMLHRHASTFAV